MKILILQLKRIGDVIQTTPAIHCLRKAFPDAHLTLVVDSTSAGLADALGADECLVHHKGAGWKSYLGEGSNAWMRRAAPNLKGDWCLDFTGTDRSALLACVSGCRRKVTFERFRRKFLRSRIYTDFVDSSVRERHTADHYADLLQPLGVHSAGGPLRVCLSEASAASAKALLASAGVSDAYAVLHAGTARAEKYWPPERWADVIKFLDEACGLPVVLTGSRDAAEQKHLAAIQNIFTGSCADLSGKTSLMETAAVIRGARIFCGVDTAAMHLADAMGTPTVALFGPTNPFHWQPRHAQSVVLRAGAKAPFTPKQKGGPMEDLETDTVLTAVRALLGEEKRQV